LKKVAVVILNWNGKKFLEQFLPALVQNTVSWAEIIIADNNSSDDSVKFLGTHYPDLRIVKNEVNGGFAKGYNDALKQIEAEYYVLLNSDIEVSSGWVEPIISMMDADKTIGACQPKLLSFFEKNKFEYAGAAGGFIDKFGYPFCRGRVFQTLEEDHGQYDDIAEIFWATGACLFVRADLYHQLGGLDEGFFAHMEEIDFCWRLKNNGYKVMYCSQSVVYHVGGGTLPKSSSRKTYLNFRNNFSLLFKNLPARRIFPVFSMRLMLDGVAAFKFLFDGGFKDFYAVLHAHFAFYRRLPSLRRKRKQLKHIDTPHMYNGSVVFNYYLKKKKSFSDL
jgi:GT2 family glycosyltransferase